MALGIRILVVDIYRVESSSMRPNFAVGDLLVVFRPAYGPNIAVLDPESNLRLQKSTGAAFPSRGDAVLYRMASGASFLKRVIAIGGDEIRFKNGVPAVDGEPLQQTPLGSGSRGGRLLRERGKSGQAYIVLDSIGEGDSDEFSATVVPAGQVFLAGDNRDSSVDSRHLGPVPVENILGRVVWKIAR